MSNAKEISPAQLAANKLNALKSTGPKTEEGKAIARYNARRHGLTGQFYCMSETDQLAYQAFETDMLRSLKPVGPYENQIAISITQDHWRLNRSRAVEFNLYGRGHDQLAGETEAPNENAHAAATMADTWHNDNRVFANIALYETRIHRMIAKNEQRLAELQTERKAAEKIARVEAELLARFADLTGLTLTEVGLDTSQAIEKTQFQVDGFVFSTTEILAKIRRDRHLENAKTCAAYGWNPKNPLIRRFIRGLKGDLKAA